MPVEVMMDTYPAEIRVDRRLLADAVEATGRCAQTCTACADACQALLNAIA